MVCRLPRHPGVTTIPHSSRALYFPLPPSPPEQGRQRVFAWAFAVLYIGLDFIEQLKSPVHLVYLVCFVSLVEPRLTG
jgi:hypothetical protein